MTSKQKTKILIPLSVFALLLIPVWIISTFLREKPGGKVKSQEEIFNKNLPTQETGEYLSTSTDKIMGSILSGSSAYKNEEVFKGVNSDLINNVNTILSKVGAGSQSEVYKVIINSDKRSAFILVKVIKVNNQTIRFELDYLKNGKGEWKLANIEEIAPFKYR